jgi:hypothetical protein
VIVYASRSNNQTERNYSSYYGECLAAVWVVSYFRIYLYGRSFVLKTNHEPLKWLMTSEKPTGTHARWASILQEYDVDIQHRAGVTHGDADGLSRNPLPSEEDWTDARMHHDRLVTSVTAGLALLACLGAEYSRRQLASQSLAALRRMEIRRQLRAVPLTPHLVMFGRIQRPSRT